MSDAADKAIDELEPLAMHRGRWDQRELLSKIVSNHFDIIEHLGGVWPTWMVDELGDGGVDECLYALNFHLERLDWMACLKLDEPYRLKILPRPSGLFLLENKQRLIFWLLALFSAWAMGIEWIRTVESSDGWLDTSILLRAMGFYAMPLMLVLLFASRAQIRVAARCGMRVGGILPILFPIQLAVWPFGIASIPSHPRMDSMPWPDARRMALICLTAPVIMLLFGTAFFVAGMLLTPASMPDLNSSPIKISSALLPELIVGLLPGDSTAELASYWLHPLGLAGMALMMMGWLSLLPLPTLPGGRIMVALLGIEDAAKTSTQIALMVLLFGFGLAYGLLEGNPLWTLVVIGGLTLLFFYGTEMRLPLILNEASAIEDNHGRNITYVFIICLLLFLPARVPFEGVQDWDADLVMEWDVMQYPDESGAFTFEIENPSLIERGISIGFWYSSSESINMTLMCPKDCNNMSIPPHSMAQVVVLPDAGMMPSQAIDTLFVTEIAGAMNHHRMTLVSGGSVHSLQAGWDWNQDHVSPELCTNLSAVNSSFTVGVDSPWRISSPIGGNLVEGAQDVCIAGDAGLLIDDHTAIGNPVLTALSGNQTRLITHLPAAPLNSIISPTAGWNLSASNGASLSLGAVPFLPSAELQISSSPYPICSSSLSHPLYSEGEHIDWNATYLSARTILPAEMNGTLSVFLPASGYLVTCNRDSPFDSEMRRILRGPALVIGGSVLDWASISLWDLAECIDCEVDGRSGTLSVNVSNLDDSEIEISVRNHGDLTPWSINSDLSLEAGSQTTLEVSWDVTGLDDPLLLAWLDVEDGNVELHLAAWSGVY